MKNPTHYLKVSFILTATLLYACGGGVGSADSHVTEIDSIQDSTLILQNDQIRDPQGANDFELANSIKVEKNETADFNWEDFRNELAAKEEAIGEGFRQEENEVATSWQNFNNEYSYQTVYLYHNEELWLQTYYRGNNPTSATDSLSNEEGKLLTKEEANKSEFRDLWKKMEERAQDLFD